MLQLTHQSCWLCAGNSRDTVGGGWPVQGGHPLATETTGAHAVRPGSSSTGLSHPAENALTPGSHNAVPGEQARAYGWREAWRRLRPSPPLPPFRQLAGRMNGRRLKHNERIFWVSNSNIIIFFFQVNNLMFEATLISTLSLRYRD